MITSEQRQARKLGIGGSDIPIIMGLSSFKTAYQLYLEKIGAIEISDEMSEPQYWGTTLEPVIKAEFERRNNVKIEDRDTVFYPFNDFLFGNLDGFIPEWNAVLEVKCSSSFMAKEWGENDSDTIPLQYLAQVAYYCAITNTEVAYIAVLIGGNNYRQYKYNKDPVLENKILEEAKKFWNCVQTKTPPEPVNQSDLRMMYPNHDPEKTKKIEVPILEQLMNLNDTRFKIKNLADVEEKHKFNIMQFMGDAECLVNEEGVPLVSWKTNKKGSRTFLIKDK